MLHSSEKYLSCIENSERVSWSISELLPSDYQLKFDKNFIATTLTQEDKLEFLNFEEKRYLNQIWGAAYLNIFAFVEEYITIFTLSLASESTFDENLKRRAYVRFSEEEIKHQILFRKYIDKFNQSFIVKCKFLDNSKDVASTILSNTKLCVILLTYHLEIVTQQHYTYSIQNNQDLDEKFKEILKFHWLEEVQHARIDLLKLQDEFNQTGEREFLDSIDEYFYILEAFVEILGEQVRMNYESLIRCCDDKVKFKDDNNRKVFFDEQLKAYVQCFILLGLEHPSFTSEVGKLSRAAANKLLDKKEKLDSIYR